MVLMRVRFASRLPGREARLYFVDGTFADKKYSVSSMHGELFMFILQLCRKEGVLPLSMPKLLLWQCQAAHFLTRVMPSRSTTPTQPSLSERTFFYMFAPACLRCFESWIDLPLEVDGMLDYVRSILMLKGSIR